MAAIDNVSFSQRLVESVWQSLNGSEVAENAYDLHRALDACLTRGKKSFRKADMGGSFVEANVSVKKAPITSQIAEGAEYDLRNIEPLQGAKWAWTTAVSPLVFGLEEVSENQGRAKIVDTIEYKTNLAIADHLDLLNVQFVRGTGTLPSAESLNTIVGTSTFGGLDPATYTAWRGYVDSTSQNLSNAVVDKAMDATMFGGSLGVDMILSGLTLFQRMKALGATATTIFQPADGRAPNSSYQGIEYVTFRDAVWLWDRQIQDVADPQGYGDTANYLYGINSSKLHFATMKGYYLQKLPMKYAPTALGWHIPIVSRYQFMTTERRSHFKLSNVGTS